MRLYAPLPRGERGGQSRKDEARRAQPRQGRASGNRALAAALGAAPPVRVSVIRWNAEGCAAGLRVLTQLFLFGFGSGASEMHDRTL